MELITMDKLGETPIELRSNLNHDWYCKYGIGDTYFTKILNGIWYFLFRYGWSVGHRNNTAVNLVTILEYFGQMNHDDEFKNRCIDKLFRIDDEAKDYYIRKCLEKEDEKRGCKYHNLRIQHEDVLDFSKRQNKIKPYLVDWLGVGIQEYILDEDFYILWEKSRIKDGILGPLFVLKVENEVNNAQEGEQ